MSSRQFMVLHLDDSTVLATLRGIWEDLGSPGDAQYSIDLMKNASANSTFSGRMSSWDQMKLLPYVRDVGTLLIRTAGVSFPDRQGSSVGITRQEGFDQVDIGLHDALPPDMALPFLAAINKRFTPTEPGPGLAKLLGPEVAEVYRRREDTAAKLEALSRRMIEDNQKYRRSVDAELEAERKRLREEAAVELGRLQEDWAKRQADLDQRAASLQEEREKLDDRRSTHARRELRRDLKKTLETRATAFTLTRDTQAKRVPVHVLFVVLVTASAIAFGSNLYAAHVAPTDWAVTLRVVLSGLALAASAGFYIRWSDRWAQEHIEEEFKLKRLDLDIDRASWVVEMALEWKDDKGGSIPPELLDRLSAGLFAPSAGATPVRHPAEDIAAALFGASASVEINTPGGGKLLLDRKSLQKLNTD